MSTYKPKRDSARWLDSDCPAGVLAVFDDKRTFDRYTVIYSRVLEYRGRMIMEYRGASENPFSPQGFGQSGEFETWQARQYRYVNRNRKCRWSDLPDDVKRLVRQDLASEEKEAA